MRLDPTQTTRALQIIRQYWGEKAQVWLFGSRVDDAKRGGDVDLYVETDESNFEKKMHTRIALKALFDLKVDLIVGQGDQPIHHIAKAKGIKLHAG